MEVGSVRAFSGLAELLTESYSKKVITTAQSARLNTFSVRNNQGLSTPFGNAVR